MEENNVDQTKSTQTPSTTIYNDEVIANLSNGLLTLYKPHLEETKKQLNELTEKQTVLIEQLHNENLKVSWTQNSVDLIKMFDTVNVYQTKLINIKKDIRSIHERNLKLKKRAIKLQQYKEKVEYLQNQQREMDLKKEQDLIGKQSQ